ncbi:MAG: right-handed parallel beta-helix repeat-containing protein [Deltaproteobacteria bacterium]|nr:right-handed parallel beta-helix repeat-containing protein [Deltaproteobacteria bacterium]
MAAVIVFFLAQNRNKISTGFNSDVKKITTSSCDDKTKIKDFQVQSYSDHAVVLQWLECNPGHYTIRGQENGMDLWTDFVKDTSSLGSENGIQNLTIGHLNADTQYRFEILDAGGNVVSKLDFSISGNLYSGTQYTGNTYYVSTKGNDGNAGTTVSAPIKTLEKVQQILDTARSPINILFETDGEWVGSLTLPDIPGASINSPVQIGAYGHGNLPRLVGSKNMNQAPWIDNGNGTYDLSIDLPGVGALFINHQMHYPARSALLRIVDGNSTSLSAEGLYGLLMFDGMQISFRGTHWSADQRNVDQISQGAVNGKNVGTVTWKVMKNLPNKGTIHNGAYLYNHPDFMRDLYDWTYDTSKNVLQLRAGTNGFQHDIRIPQHNYGLIVIGDHYRIRDLGLHYYHKDAIFSEGTDLHVSYNELSHNYNSGLYVYGSKTDGLEVSHNRIHNISGVGVFGQRSSFSRVTYNAIFDIGDQAWGRATGLDGQLGAANNQFLTGITFYSTQSNYIAYNQIENVGYVGIRFDGKNHIAEYNQIIDPLRQLSDGGGIYSFQAAKATYQTKENLIQKNIIDNTQADNQVGYKMDKPNAKLMHVGIYMDNNSKTTKILDNTIIGCTDICILLNRHNDGHTIDGNILYGENKILQVTRAQKNTFIQSETMSWLDLLILPT